MHTSPDQSQPRIIPDSTINDQESFTTEWRKFAKIFFEYAVPSFEDDFAPQFAFRAKGALIEWHRLFDHQPVNPEAVLEGFHTLRAAVAAWETHVSRIIHTHNQEIAFTLSALLNLLLRSDQKDQYGATIQALQSLRPPYSDVVQVLKQHRLTISPEIQRLGNQEKPKRDMLVQALRSLIYSKYPTKNPATSILKLLDSGKERVTKSFLEGKATRDKLKMREQELVSIGTVIQSYCHHKRRPNDEKVYVANTEIDGVYIVTYAIYEVDGVTVRKESSDTFYGDAVPKQHSTYRTFNESLIGPRMHLLRKALSIRPEAIVLPPRNTPKPQARPAQQYKTEEAIHTGAEASEAVTQKTAAQSLGLLQTARKAINNALNQTKARLQKTTTAILDTKVPKGLFFWNTPIPKSIFFWNTPIRKTSFFWNRPIPKSFNRSTFLRVLAALALVGIMKNVEERFHTPPTDHTTSSTAHQQRQTRTTTPGHATTTTTNETATVGSPTAFETMPTLPAPTPGPETMLDAPPEVTTDTTATLATTPEGVVLGSASVSHGSRYASTSLQHNTDETLQRIVGTLGYNSVQTKVIATRLDQQLLTARNMIGPHLHTQKTDTVVLRSQMSNGHEQIQVQVTDPSGHIRYQTDWFDREVGFRHFVPSR